jgi:hypothetical protein
MSLRCSIAVAAILMSAPAHAAETVLRHAAGSLRDAQRARVLHVGRRKDLGLGPAGDLLLQEARRAVSGLHREPAVDSKGGAGRQGRAGGPVRPQPVVVRLPDTLAVAADYGLTVLSAAGPAAYRFAMFILADGQRILAKHGFTAPNLNGAPP